MLSNLLYTSIELEAIQPTHENETILTAFRYSNPTHILTYLPIKSTLSIPNPFSIFNVKQNQKPQYDE